MTNATSRTAADIMRRDVVTVRSHWDVQDALTVLSDHGISGAPVLDAGGGLVGVVSVADIARAEPAKRARTESTFYRQAVPDEFPSLFPPSLKSRVPILVAEVMTRVVIDAPESAPVRSLASLMIERHIHRVIITRGGAVVGIVSSLDLLQLVQ